MINIVFDVDDTLYDLMDPFEKTHNKFFSNYENIDIKKLFTSSRIYANELFELEKQGKIKKTGMFSKRIKLTYKDIGIDLTEEECEQFGIEYYNNQKNIRLYSFMKEILDYCKNEKINLAILTNGESKKQRNKIKALGLKKWIDENNIFISGEIGFQKPDIEVFKIIEKKLKFKPNNTWYIGDSYELDIVGAKKAKWNTIWFNHRKKIYPNIKNQNNIEIIEGSEILKYIKTINK